MLKLKRKVVLFSSRVLAGVLPVLMLALTSTESAWAVTKAQKVIAATTQNNVGAHLFYVLTNLIGSFSLFILLAAFLAPLLLRARSFHLPSFVLILVGYLYLLFSQFQYHGHNSSKTKKV